MKYNVTVNEILLDSLCVQWSQCRAEQWPGQVKYCPRTQVTSQCFSVSHLSLGCTGQGVLIRWRNIRYKSVIVTILFLFGTSANTFLKLNWFDLLLIISFFIELGSLWIYQSAQWSWTIQLELLTQSPTGDKLWDSQSLDQVNKSSFISPFMNIQNIAWCCAKAYDYNSYPIANLQANLLRKVSPKLLRSSMRKRKWFGSTWDRSLLLTLEVFQ